MYGSYNGNLYQVTRANDKATKDIPVIEAGGYANAKIQDEFCSGTTCTISILYDQSGKKNHLTPAPGGGAVKTADKPVVATDEKLYVNGHSVYGMKFRGGMGYRNNKTSGIATGDLPESMYMVTSGTFFNSLCCFDYGNAETTNNDDGAGTMEAIYFGNQSTYWGWGNTSTLTNGKKGPWVEADLENGLFAGNVYGEYKGNDPLNHTYVTAMLKGKSNWFTLKGRNANTGALKTMYDGIRPTFSDGKYKWNPQRLQGAIILGIGGDNSNGSQGIFYEGCMISGYATSAADDELQKNVIAAGYGSTIPLATDLRGSSPTRIGYDAANRIVSIDFTVDKDQAVTVDILDLRGQWIARIQQGTASVGSHQAMWNWSNSPRGVYMVRISGTRGLMQTAKVVLGD